MSMTTGEAFAEASTLFLAASHTDDQEAWLEMMIEVLGDEHHELPPCLLAVRDLFPDPVILAAVAYTAGLLNERERHEGGTL